MRHPWEWSEGKHLTDTLLEMGFLEGPMTFRKRAALAEYLDTYFERREKERRENEDRMKDFHRG